MAKKTMHRGTSLPQTHYAHEHFGELTDVNGRHVKWEIDIQWANSRTPHGRVTRHLKDTALRARSANYASAAA